MHKLKTSVKGNLILKSKLSDGSFNWQTVEVEFGMIMPFDASRNGSIIPEVVGIEWLDFNTENKDNS